jgi:para-aminobenzoate synthetase/4-amino-4-deoxychorismate lyase
MKFNDIINLVEYNPYAAFFYTPSIYAKATSYLFLKPYEIISIQPNQDHNYAFKTAQKLIKKNYSGYILINYEAAFLFEQKLSHLLEQGNQKLIQVVFFDKDNIKKLKSSKIIFDHSGQGNYSVSDYRLNRSKAEFIDDINKIKHYIGEGDTYQVNYTIKALFKFSGSYSSFFQKLLFNQSAKYAAFINNNDVYILSLSPELFFNQKNKKIISHPMKGTLRRGFNNNSDKVLKTELINSEKNLAENVMIVDLIRNDLGRICRYGSVSVPALFKIEKYESLLQMVSEVEGTLRKKINLKELINNLFPCGSVTGAPKIRTMQIINEIEKAARGIYTGSIGIITPKEIKMNVAIRTITLNKNSGDGVMGLGSGIVWDSDPQSEFEENILKSKFLTEPLKYFEIFETMKYESGKIWFLDDHLLRMKSAADFFLFKFNEKKIKKQLENVLFGLAEHSNKKIRLALAKCGEIRIEVSEIKVTGNNDSAIVSQSRINSTDKFRHFKTTDRKLYDDEYEHFCSKGFFEVLYLNEKNELAEGSRTNIFLRKQKSWFTPSLESGALPGIYRKHFIANIRNISERTLTIEDLKIADALVLTNALQGEIKVKKLFLSPRDFILYK